MKKAAVLFLMVTVCVLACKKTDYNAAPKKEVSKSVNGKGKADGLIVTFDTDDAANKSGYVVKQKIHTAMEKHGAKPFFVLDAPETAIEGLKKNPHVKSVSPNYTMTIPEPDFSPIATRNISTKKYNVPLFSKPTTSEKNVGINQFTFLKSNFNSSTPSSSSKTLSVTDYPNDSIYVSGAQWGANNINAAAAWATNKGSQKVYVGLIDEGVYYWHPDLCGQVDAKHSYDFYNNDSTIFDFADTHGTHTAGTIGAITNNSIGVAGISPNVTIVNAKFLQQTGSTAAAIQAIDYITMLKVDSGFNFVCTSNSWGYQGGPVPELRDAIRRAGQANILFNAAAGNNGANSDIDSFYPADFCNPNDVDNYCDNVISVGALQAGDQPASFSNYGAITVNIFAPGVGIWSTGYDANANPVYYNFSGTSMATPHVSGAEALYKAGHQNATFAEVKNAILNNARPLAVLQGKCTTGGTLNVATFTQGNNDAIVNRSCSHPAIDITPPSKVTNVHMVTSTNSSITFAWDSASDPESGIYFYGVLIRRDGLPDATYSLFGTQVTFSGLPQGDTTRIQVYAINHSNQTGPGSDWCTGWTTGQHDNIPPSIPQNYHVVSMTPSGGNLDVVLDWNVCTDNVGMYGYFGEGGDLRTGRDHWSFGYNVNAFDVHGNPHTGVVLGGMPVNDTFWTHVQSFDASGNRSAFSDTLWFVTSGTVAPPMPVINSFTVNPDVIDSGGSTLMSWNTTNATSVSISGIGQVDAIGSINLFARETATYVLTASNSSGSVNSSVTVTVNKPNPPPPPPPPPPTLSVTLSGSVNGNTHTLTWAITGTPTNVDFQEITNGVVTHLAPTGVNSYTYIQKGKKPRTFQVVIKDATQTATSNQVTLK